MIIKSSEADRFVMAPPKELKAALVFGPDQGLVHERAEKLAKTVVADLGDPFRVADLEESALMADGARLFDEAAALSMLGGRRVVRVRAAANNLAKLFESFLTESAGEALVVVEAGDLAKGTGLRRLFEEDDKAVAIPCYADTARDLYEVVRSTLKEYGVGIAADAVEEAVSRLGSDRGVTRRELEKLALYAGREQVTRDDVRAVMGDEAEARVEEVCDAAGSGDLARLDLALERFFSADGNPVAVLRTAMSHFQRLALTRALAARGESIDAVMRRMRPPIHFSRATAFKGQANRWSDERLAEALDLLLDAEALCKTTAVPAQAACGRALFNVAAMVRMRG